jgi:hypothetical protein
MSKAKEINWKLVKENDCLFALNESKEKLRHSIEYNDGLCKKAFFLIGMLLTLITGLSGFIFNTNKSILFAFPTIILLAFLVKALRHLLHIVKSRKFHSIGNLPSEILQEKNMLDSLYMQECELMSYEQRIKENLKTNIKDGKNINKAIKTIFHGFIFSIIIFILMSFFISILCQG